MPLQLLNQRYGNSWYARALIKNTKCHQSGSKQADQEVRRHLRTWSRKSATQKSSTRKLGQIKQQLNRHAGNKKLCISNRSHCKGRTSNGLGQVVEKILGI